MAPDNGWPSTDWTGLTQSMTQISQSFQALGPPIRSAGRAIARVVQAMQLWTNPRERDRYHLARLRIPAVAPVVPVYQPQLPVVRSYVLRMNSAGRPGRRARRVAGTRV